MTKASLKQLIFNSEITFKRCWNTLLNIHDSDFKSDDAALRLLLFQSELASSIRNLEIGYNALCGDKTKLIRNKNTYKFSYFKSRILLIESQKDLITDTIDVAKTIGDSFAWFFYQSEFELLQKHAERPAIMHGLTGKGGVGEIEFIRRATRLGSYFVLSHSITTFLRLGDVSFIDFSNLKVAGIGELKSHVVESKVFVNLHIVGGKIKKEILSSLKTIPTADSELPSVDLSFEAQNRLQRQLSILRETFQPRDESRVIATEGEHKCELTYKALEAIFLDAHHESFPSAKTDRGLVIAGFRNKGKSFFGCMKSTNAPTAPKYLHQVLKTVETILDPLLSDNSIRINWLNYPSNGRYVLPWGMRPVFWWPISSKLKEAIVFKTFHVSTYFNAAFFIKDLRSKGFIVESLATGEIRVSRKLEHGSAAIEGMPYFLSFIQRFLISDSSVCELITAATHAVDKKGFKGNAHVKFAMSILYK